MRNYAVVMLMVFSAQACVANGDTKQASKTDKISKEVVDITRLSVPELKKLETRWYKSIQASIDPTCNSDSECKSIAVGVNPCGGPLQYKIYSQASTKEQELQTLVKKYNSLSRYMNKKLGRMGACVFLEPPALSCKNKKCSSKSLMLR